MENLVGRKIKGFRVELENGLVFNPKMKNYIGEIGVIESVFDNYVKVQFEDDSWIYPLDQIQPHLIPLEIFKLGQKVWDMSISDEAGVVVQVIDFKFDYPIKVEFGEEVLSYTLDGKFNKDYPKTLSTAPYIFQGFSQETIIERGTLVYFRDSECENWNIGFYKEGKSYVHFIFENQQKEGKSFSWKFCQTENPLI